MPSRARWQEKGVHLSSQAQWDNGTMGQWNVCVTLTKAVLQCEAHGLTHSGFTDRLPSWRPVTRGRWSETGENLPRPGAQTSRAPLFMRTPHYHGPQCCMNNDSRVPHLTCRGGEVGRGSSPVLTHTGESVSMMRCQRTHHDTLRVEANRQECSSGSREDKKSVSWPPLGQW